MTFSIIPKKIYQANSKISGKIVVREWLGEKSLVVQGVIQSGGIVKGIWCKALRKVRSTKLEVGRVLIMGLGGGTAVHLIKSIWPAAKITAVEIDPEVIKIAKRFFGLNKFIESGDLKILCSNAIDWVASCIDVSIHEYKNFLSKKQNKHDLIIVDLYLGDQFPKEAESEKFLKSLKKILSENGVVIFNRLRTDETENFERNLRKYFSAVYKVNTPANYLFICSIKNN